MDSPSAQLIDGPASSPFVSEVKSRIASKGWESPQELSYGQTPDISTTPRKAWVDVVGDKENLPQTPHAQPTALSSPKLSTPKQSQSQRMTPQKDATETHNDLPEMPPPKSTRRTPKRSPLKPAPNTTCTPSTVSRANLFQHSESLLKNGDSVRRSGREPRTPPQDQTSVDDTCFSTFSEIPDMTLFAKLGQSTAKKTDAFRTPGRQLEATPRTSRKRSSPSRSPSPTPRRLKTPMCSNNDGTTNFLIDFTQQMENVSSYKHASTKSSTQPDLLNYLNSQRSPNKSSRQSFATPAKSSSLLNLLDFELPPAPTPRSIPTITVRELESLKSSYLSQISSLKATLSGREAEVESLKRAIGDAERRAGEVQEAYREEKCRRENADEEKAQWERRGQEVENVLKSVREEVLKGEAEKDDLLNQIESGERRADEAESRAAKAEERYTEALATLATASSSSSSSSSSESNNGSSGTGSEAIEAQVQTLVAAQIDAKIEAVSRELHSVYKEKHERKVATLKKSYEARGEKKCAELQARLAELEKANEELQAAKDATFSGPVPDTSMMMDVTAELKAQIEEQKAYFARLEGELEASKRQRVELERELEQERIEKGDLVAAVDEMLLLQSEQGGSNSASSSTVAAAAAAATATASQSAAMSVVEDFRKSVSRPQGLRLPSATAGAGESRIGRGGLGFGMNRSVSGLGRSKLGGMEKLEKSAGASGNESMMVDT